MQDWQYQQQLDEQQRMEEAERILRAATWRPITKDEQDFLAVEAGISDYFKRT